MKVAIVHDWLVTYAGAEKVLEQIIDIYPDADLFSLVDFLEPSERRFIKDKEVTTSLIQKLPMAKKCYNTYLLCHVRLNSWMCSAYDVVISSSML